MGWVVTVQIQGLCDLVIVHQCAGGGPHMDLCPSAPSSVISLPCELGTESSSVAMV
jgi:hypothetical protein